MITQTDLITAKQASPIQGIHPVVEQAQYRNRSILGNVANNVTILNNPSILVGKASISGDFKGVESRGGPRGRHFFKIVHFPFTPEKFSADPF